MAETIRACRREDIPSVAGMFSRVFLKQKRAASRRPGPTISSELVFGGQLHGGEARSRVFVDKAGEVRGFIGMWPRPMLLQGRSIEAAAAGSLMVERSGGESDRRRAVAALVPHRSAGSFVQRDVNDISQRMWERAGGERLTATSLDWLRVLRPAGLATHMRRHSVSRRLSAEPRCAKIADRVARRAPHAACR